VKIRLKQDWNIPAGTELECIDGLTRTFVEGNYEGLVALSPDSVAYVIIGREALEDRSELFEEIE